MATELVKLAAPQLGIISLVITALQNSSTKKELKKYRAQLYSYLRTVRPKDLTDFKADDLTYIRKVYDARNLDITYEFWYEHDRDEV